MIPPKPGCNRLSRKDKQAGWSVPDKTRSQSRTAMAVERFLYNLTRPTDQRHQPVPKKRDSSSLGCMPSYLAPALGDKKGGKMKVILTRK